MRPGVRGAYHQTVAQSLLCANLQRVIAGDPFSFPKIGVGVVTDVWNPESRVAIRSRELSDCRSHLLGLENSRASIRIRGLVTIGINLAIDGVRWGGKATV